MNNHEVSFRNHALDLYVFTVPLTRHSFEVVNEALLVICHVRVVLDIVVARVVLDGPAWQTFVKYQLVETANVALIPLNVCHLPSLPRVAWSTLRSNSR